MITFNELYIDSNKKLIVDASVLDVQVDPQRQIGIDHILVGYGTNQDPYNYIRDIDNTNIFDRVDRVGDVIRGFRLVLDLSINGNCNKLIFVKITVDEGTVEIPCTLNTSIEGYAYDRCLLLEKVFNYIKASNASCESLQDYANYIVQVNGLELAVESGNFSLANLYWNKFFANSACCGNSLTHKSGCGCRR
jgi:hypothetical protein